MNFLENSLKGPTAGSEFALENYCGFERLKYSTQLFRTGCTNGLNLMPMERTYSNLWTISYGSYPDKPESSTGSEV